MKARSGLFTTAQGIRKKIALGGATILGLSCILATPISAAASDTPPSNAKGDRVSVEEEKVDAPTADFMAAQARLLPVTKAIQAAVDPLESGHPVSIDGTQDNFAEVSVDPTANLVNLYWKGPVPEAITAIMSKYPSTAVKIHDVRFSLNDLTTAEDALDLHLHQLHDLGAGVQLQSASIDPATANLTATIYSNGSVPLQSVADVMAKITSVPVAVTITTARTPTGGFPLASRLNDTPAYFGGDGVWLNSNQEYCTTGFGITINGSGNQYATTAFHCTYDLSSTGSVNNPTTGGSYGTYNNESSHRRAEYDTLLLGMNGSDAGSAYVGAYNSSSNVIVSGSDTSTIGQAVCIDGARSGDHCSPIVHAKNGVYYEVDGTRIAGNVEADSQVTAGMNGDSGGPVLEGSSSTRQGLGMLFEGIPGSETTCPTSVYQPSLGGTCYKKVIYTSLSGMLGSFGASLN